MIPQIGAAVVGIWLMVAPAVLSYTGAAATNDRIFGPTAAALAGMAMFEVLRGVRFAETPIGLWLTIAPFVLDYPVDATISSVAAGIALIALSIPQGKTNQSYGGGWSYLLRADVDARER